MSLLEVEGMRPVEENQSEQESPELPGRLTGRGNPPEDTVQAQDHSLRERE